MNVSTVYRSKGFFDYPRMKETLFKTMSDPNHEIKIESDFTEKKSGSVFARISRFVQKIFFKLKLFFSKTARRKFNLAIKKISLAYFSTIKKTERLQELKQLEKDKVYEKCLNSQIDYLKDQLKKIVGDQKPKKYVRKLSKLIEKERKILESAEKLLSYLRWNINGINKRKKMIRCRDKGFDFKDLKSEILRHTLIKETFEQIKSDISSLMDKINNFERGVELKKERVLTPYQQIFSDIESKVNKNIADLFKVVFDKTGLRDRLEDWTCDDNGQAELKLNKKIKFWVPSKSPKDPIGGVVMMIGPVLKVHLSSKGMHFNKGFSTYCRAPFFIPLVGNYITATVSDLTYNSEQKVGFRAGAAGQYKTRHKTFENLMRSWSQHSIDLSDKSKKEHKKFIWQKYKE